MWTRITFILVVASFMLGCKDNGTQSQPNIDPDEALGQTIVGSWKAIHPWALSSQSASWYRIDFRADGTFADTIYDAYNYFQPNDTLTIIRTGNYSIQNRVVEYLNVSFSYRTVSGQPMGVGSSKWPEALTIIGDSLVMTKANVLSPVDSTTTGVQGNWRFVFWSFMSTPDSLNPIYTGRRQVTHMFAGDSSYSQAWRYLDSSDWPEQTWQGSYHYSPPSLRTSAGGAIENVRVEFFKSRMYWFYSDYQTLKVGRIR